MRGNARRSAREEEEESAFVSMTDMTVSFLFIVMIVLAFFASRLRDPNQVPKAVAKAVGHGRMNKVPLRSDIVQSARDMGIGFGD